MFLLAQASLVLFTQSIMTIVLQTITKIALLKSYSESYYLQ